MGTLEGYVEGMINLSGGGGGGTSDYEDLTNKPSINDVMLSGNKTTSDLNVSYNDLLDKPSINGVTLSGNKTTSDLNVSYNDLQNKPYINNMPPSTSANIGDVLTHTSEGDNWVAPEGGKINYSTEEIEIGTWINGTPVYQKTIIINGNYSGRTTIDISNYIETGTKLIACEGIGKYTGGSDNYYALNGYNIFIYPNENINTIKTNWGSSTLPVEIILTIKYIKTT